MKRLSLLTLVLLFAGLATIQAQNLKTQVAQLPVELKSEITNAIVYPKEAQRAGIEGDVWMRFAVTPEKKIQIIELSSTMPELGDFVETSLEDLSLSEDFNKKGMEYYLKISFELIK